MLTRPVVENACVLTRPVVENACVLTRPVVENACVLTRPVVENACVLTRPVVENAKVIINNEKFIHFVYSIFRWTSIHHHPDYSAVKWKKRLSTTFQV